jgi:hypothetical protein
MHLIYSVSLLRMRIETCEYFTNVNHVNHIRFRIFIHHLRLSLYYNKMNDIMKSIVMVRYD